MPHSGGRLVGMQSVRGANGNGRRARRGRGVDELCSKQIVDRPRLSLRTDALGDHCFHVLDLGGRLARRRGRHVEVLAGTESEPQCVVVFLEVEEAAARHCGCQLAMLERGVLRELFDARDGPGHFGPELVHALREEELPRCVCA